LGGHSTLLNFFITDCFLVLELIHVKDAVEWDTNSPKLRPQSSSIVIYFLVKIKLALSFLASL
jgi:hypothetical protein